MTLPRDDNGYQITADDLSFLGITATQMEEMEARTVPLGLTVDRYRRLVEGLVEAAALDGITTLDARLKGSSATFFSGRHKIMPFERSDVLTDFEQGHQRIPEVFELDDIMRTLKERWPDPDSRPRRRPFDALYRLNVSPYPSDFDVQISSNQISDRALETLDALRVPCDQYDMTHPAYRFINKRIVKKVVPNLTNWSVIWSRILGLREVTIAAFPGGGPQEMPDDREGLSSHFRATDWILVTL